MLWFLCDWRARIKGRLADRLDLILENLALQHQVMVYERGRPLRSRDRFWWCLLARFWSRWREPLTFVQPATVLRWRRTPLWRHLSGHRRRRGGRPRIDRELQALIQRMAAENRLWGSMRIVGVLRALGFKVSNSTVRRYRAAVRRPPPTQHWSTFFHNHGPYILEALRNELHARSRCLLEMLLGSPPVDTAGEPSDLWPIEMPAEYRELIEQRFGQWLCRCPACQRTSHSARDPPALRRDAA